jgi:hypothetical protein
MTQSEAGLFSTKDWTIQVMNLNRCRNLTPGTHKCRWEDNIKMNLQEVGWGRHGLDDCGSK